MLSFYGYNDVVKHILAKIGVSISQFVHMFNGSFYERSQKIVIRIKNGYNNAENYTLVKIKIVYVSICP